MTVNELVLFGRRTIEKEAQALAALVDKLDDDFARVCELLYGCRGTILVTGMGKSGLVARKWAATLAGTGTAAYFLNPAEASHGDLGIVRSDDVVVALSYSGETDELGVVLRHCREHNVAAVGVTGNRKSSLARQVQLVLSIELTEEACPLGLAPTSSTTMMMALGDAVAVTLMQMRGFTEQDFARLHPGGSLGRRLWLRVEQLMHAGDEIPRVAAAATLGAVLVEMTSKRLGLAIVMNGDEVLGVITDGDLRRHFQSGEPNAAATAAELMTRDPKTLSRDALAIEARELMEASRITQLLITGENGVLAGVVHLHDLLRAKVL